ALDPQYAPAHLFQAWHSIIVGNAADALREIQRAVDFDPLSVILNTRWASMLYYTHRYDEAIARLRKTLEVDSTNVLVHAELERGYEGRDTYMTFLKVEPLYDAVRDDPRFARLVKRVGLEP